MTGGVIDCPIESAPEGRVEALATLCEVLGIGWTPVRREQATTLDHDGLRRLFDRITTERRWPD